MTTSELKKNPLEELCQTILLQLPPIKPTPRIFVPKDKYDVFLNAITPMYRFQDTRIKEEGIENFLYAKCAICCLEEK